MANAETEGRPESGRIDPFETFPDLTRRQATYVTVVAFLVWALAAYDVQLFGSLRPILTHDFGCSGSQATWIAAAVQVVAVMAALVVWRLADGPVLWLALAFLGAMAVSGAALLVAPAGWLVLLGASELPLVLVLVLRIWLAESPVRS